LLFQQALQQADLQLLRRRLRGQRGEKFRRRGSAGHTFKTVFGTVHVRRARLENQDTGATHRPAAVAWQTPQQVCITDGLRHAGCDALLAQSAQNALHAAEARAGETGLLSKAELLKIVHQDGQPLRQAAGQRAEAALAEHPQAKELLLPAVAPPRPEELVAADEAAAAPAEEGAAEAAPPLGFAGSDVAAEAAAAAELRRVDPGWVVVEPDGVITHAQPQTGGKRLESYTAVVLRAGRSCCFAAASPQDLITEVAGLLASLGVQEGQRRRLFLADGARWIREWFEGLRVRDKAMLLCRYHLVKRTQPLLSLACRGRQHRRAVEAPMLHHLGRGRVDEAVKPLSAARGPMQKPEALDELVGYLEARRPYLAD
jgi:hypothetical protein